MIITEQLYKEIKLVAKNAMGTMSVKEIDEVIEKGYGVKKTTSRLIRNTGNYNEYRNKVTKKTKIKKCKAEKEGLKAEAINWQKNYEAMKKKYAKLNTENLRLIDQCSILNRAKEDEAEAISKYRTAAMIAWFEVAIIIGLVLAFIFVK